MRAGARVVWPTTLQNTSSELDSRVKILRLARWFANLPSTPEFNVLVFSFLINLAWELWQVTFFQGMAEQPHGAGAKACTQATFGDAGIALAAFWVTAFFARTRSWIMQPSKSDIAIFIGVGLVATIIFETLATGVLERWAYSDAMPRLPVLGTGLLPLLQWLALPPLVLWFVRRQIAPGYREQSDGKATADGARDLSNGD
jgi:hypothetical protein